MAKKVPMRLRYLRVKSGGAAGNELGPHAQQLKACEDELTSLMSCWRANGVDSAPCLAAVQALAMCSSAAVARAQKPLQPSFNYMLKKMFCHLNSNSNK